MNSTQAAPALPPPPPPAQAARSLAEAALAASEAWRQPLDPARHAQAVSQLYSALRDLGIATRGLAGWQPAGMPPAEFTANVTAAAEQLLLAWGSLDGILAFEGPGQLPDPDDPGTVLCHAARLAILAWRHPCGSGSDRSTATRLLSTATASLIAATASLAATAARHRTIGLQAAGASLAQVPAHLAAAIREPGNRTTPGPALEPARHPPGVPE